MDTIGPINSDDKIIEANDNYNYVLVIIDAFSRFIQIYPTKSTSAQDGLYSVFLSSSQTCIRDEFEIIGLVIELMWVVQWKST